MTLFKRTLIAASISMLFGGMAAASSAPTTELPSTLKTDLTSALPGVVFGTDGQVTWNTLTFVPLRHLVMIQPNPRPIWVI